MSKYTEAVAEARTLVKRSEADQWRLAELTWQQVEAGKSRMQWAKDIGVDKAHAQRLYKIWTKWGGDSVSTRPRFADAYAEARGGGATTVTEQGQQQAIGTLRNLPPARKAEAARELLADPEVAYTTIREAVKADPVAAAAASDALDDRWESTARPQPRDRSKADRLSDTLLAARAAQRKVNEFANVVSGTSWSAEERDALLPLIDKIITVLDMAKVGVQSGSWDEQLADLLGGQ